LSSLEDLIRGEYEPSADRLDPDDDGDTHTRAVNMRVRRRMEVSSNGLHEMLAEAISLLAISDGSVDGTLTNEHDAGERQEQAIKREPRDGRHKMYEAMRNAMSDSKSVWKLIRLARALRMEMEEARKDCKVWDDRDAERKSACVDQRICSINGMAHKIMTMCATIMKHSGTVGGRQGDGEWAKKRAEKRESCVWSVIQLCRRSLEEVEGVLCDALDW
jgi:hypothetical protein